MKALELNTSLWGRFTNYVSCDILFLLTKMLVHIISYITYPKKRYFALRLKMSSKVWKGSYGYKGSGTGCENGS